MANSYTPQDFRLVKPTKVLGASLTNEAISNEIGLTYNGSLNLRVDVVTSAVTVGAGITVKLQMRSGNFEAWADVAGANASASVTAAGTFSMRQNVEVAADQANMPLKKQVRVVATTGAGSAVTINEVRCSQGM